MHPTPDDEARRLAVVRTIAAAVGSHSAVLDHMAQVAHDLFKAPVGLITIVGEHEQIFAGRAGTDLEKTTGDNAMCSETIRGDDVFVVSNLAEDARFAGTPLVAGAPFLKFYAGAPIRLACGAAVGAICVADVMPREFTVGQRVLLKHMALAAKAEFEGMVPPAAMAAAQSIRPFAR